MKILMLEWKSFGNEDIISAFKELGHDVKAIPFSKDELHHDDKADSRNVQLLSRLRIFIQLFSHCVSGM